MNEELRKDTQRIIDLLYDGSTVDFVVSIYKMLTEEQQNDFRKELAKIKPQA